MTRAYGCIRRNGFALWWSQSARRLAQLARLA